MGGDIMKRFLLVFLLTLAVLPAFAQVKPHTFSPNDPVSSAKINSNYDVIYQWCQELATQALTLHSKTLYSSSDTSSPYWHKNNDGSGSGLDADLLDGYHASHTRNLANSIPIRDGSGYLQLGWINTTSGSAGTTAPDRVYASYDSYLRYYTPANFKTVMGLIHTGNFQSTNSSGVVNPNNTTMNGLYYCNSVNLFGQTDGALYNQAYSSAWQGQIFQDYRTGQLALRGKNNGTWQPWRTVRDSTNFVAGTDSASYCAGNDSRLSNARTPTSHTHGSITNDGKVGTTANLPLITGTGGVVQAGSFGTAANTFCQGNDSRLSDARTPTAHTHSEYRKHIKNPITTAAAGWYRVARLNGSAGRGNCEVSLYTTGGNYDPQTLKISCYHNWASNAQLEVVAEGASYWSGVRITNDGTYAYVEVNFSRAMSCNAYGLDPFGYDAGYTIYSGTLTAGGGTVRTTLNVPMSGMYFNSTMTLPDTQANTVALRDGSGDITSRLFRSTYADQTTTPATTIGLAFRNSTSDNYIRFMTAAAFKAWLLSAKIGVVQTSRPASPVNGDIWIE